ncbi:MAG: hypothetical protein Q8K68_05965 [Nitrospirota bacterium]|nr:hypothetical protein [Nitrospirota bacterium]
MKKIKIMKSRKKVDCVEMKWDIQQRVLQEYKGLSEDKIIALQKKKLKNNPLLSSFVEKVKIIRTEGVKAP